MSEIEYKLKLCAEKINKKLTEILSSAVQDHEISRPELLMDAMRYSALSGGKQLRSFLLYNVTEMLQGNIEYALQIGSAIELLHSYSLIHDDLPSMDNDDFRRGKPSLHKRYDEATAILAGDALLTLAFEVIASPKYNLEPKIKLNLIWRLAKAAGCGGMVGGQILDLQYEGKETTEREILTTQSMKTGALLKFCCYAGAVISTDDPHIIEILQQYGEAIGLAFQLRDDILDIIGQQEILGKSCGKDQKSEKNTIVKLYGIKESEIQLHGLINEAKALLQRFGEKANNLKELADFIQNREF